MIRYRDTVHPWSTPVEPRRDLLPTQHHGDWDVGDINTIIERERIRYRLPRRRALVLTPILHFGHAHDPRTKVENGDIVLARIKARLAKPEPPPPKPPEPTYVEPRRVREIYMPEAILTDINLKALRVASYAVASIAVACDKFMWFTAYEMGLQNGHVDHIRFPREHVAAAVEWCRYHIALGRAVVPAHGPNDGGSAWVLRHAAAIDPRYDFRIFAERLAARGLTIPEAP